MKYRSTLLKPILFSLLFFLILCCQGHHTGWERNTMLDDIAFKKLRYFIKGSDTSAIIGYLKSDTRIKNYPCKKGFVHLSTDLEPELFCLSENIRIHHVDFSEDTWIIHMPDTNYFIAVFPENNLFRNYPCKGGGGSAGIHTVFYKSGSLRSFFAYEDVKIDDIWCKKGVFVPVKFYESGKLYSCKLAMDAHIKGEKVRKGAVIYLDEKGNLITTDRKK